MAVSKKQQEANRKNAQKSTGPVTPEGKAKVAHNALRHGILSRKLILPHENEEEFNAIHNELIDSLSPANLLESILVEKIAVCIWKQQRLVQAENATLCLGTRTEQIATGVSGLFYDVTSTGTITENDFEPTNKSHLDWLTAAASELLELNITKIKYTLDLKESAPVSYKKLQDDARSTGLSVTSYLTQRKINITQYLVGLKDYCIKEIDKIQRKPLIMQIAQWVQMRESISFGEIERLFSRYQTSLDSELYKAMKALQEQQKSRRETKETEVIVVEED